jgi:hypothetical protein
MKSITNHHKINLFSFFFLWRNTKNIPFPNWSLSLRYNLSIRQSQNMYTVYSIYKSQIILQFYNLYYESWLITSVVHSDPDPAGSEIICKLGSGSVINSGSDSGSGFEKIISDAQHCSLLIRYFKILTYVMPHRGRVSKVASTRRAARSTLLVLLVVSFSRNLRTFPTLWLYLLHVCGGKSQPYFMRRLHERFYFCFFNQKITDGPLTINLYVILFFLIWNWQVTYIFCSLKNNKFRFPHRASDLTLHHCPSPPGILWVLPFQHGFI